METAAAAHMPGDRLAKTVLLEDDEGHVAAVLPTTHAVRLWDLWVKTGRHLVLAREIELRELFKDCDVGALPPVCMAYGMKTTAYELEIKAQCPQAEVVYDLFHVVAKYGREVIDRVRVDQANQLRHDRPARTVLKSSRWLLLRNRHHLKPEQSVHLKDLLAAIQSLLCVYVLRDELKRLWFYQKPAWAQKAWEQWVEQARQSGIAALQLFAQRLQGYWHGILARCRHQLNTSVVEGNGRGDGRR